MNNELNPHAVVVHIGTLAATTTLPAMKTLRKSRILRVTYFDQAGIAADNTNFLQVELKKGSTVIASVDTRAANQGAVTANVGKDMPLVTAQIDQAKDSDLVLTCTKNGTGVPTLAKVQIDFFPY